MKRLLGAVVVASLAFGPGSGARGDEAEAKAVLDKAIKALGGEEKLGKAAAISWKAKGKITFGDNENDISSSLTAQGVDRYRSEFEGEFNGNTVRGVTVVNGDKGWRKFGDNEMELDGDALANTKRTIYLQVVPTTLVALKGNGFKVETAGEEKVGDAPASVLKVTAPDGKDFKIYFDKSSGLPVKLVAVVAGFNGEEFTQETTYADYKDFGGIKKATKVESKRDGNPFIASQVTEFKLLDNVNPETFAPPK